MLYFTLTSQINSMDKTQEKANQALKEFIRYSSSPWRVVWTNFVAGIFRGLGTVIGASIVIALLFWLLGFFSSLPLIGEYASKIRSEVTGYVEETNYNDEFNRIGDTLERIEKELAENPQGE